MYKYTCHLLKYRIEFVYGNLCRISRQMFNPHDKESSRKLSNTDTHRHPVKCMEGWLVWMCFASGVVLKITSQMKSFQF